MKASVFYFLVEVADGTNWTFVGGGLKPSERPGFVWLTTPDGRPVLEVPRQAVHPTTPEATASRVVAERLASKGALN